MERQHHIPLDYEIHSVEFLARRGNPVPQYLEDGVSREPAVNQSDGLRHQLYEQCLKNIARMEGLAVYTVFRDNTDRTGLYERLLDWIEEECRHQETEALLVVDGGDPLFKRAHRRLPRKKRVIVEDPWMKDSHESQLVQVADVVVHSALQYAVKRGSRGFMWTWYGDYLAHLSPNAEAGRAGILDL